jgi:hypothetical protein
MVRGAHLFHICHHSWALKYLVCCYINFGIPTISIYLNQSILDVSFRKFDYVKIERQCNLMPHSSTRELQQAMSCARRFGKQIIATFFLSLSPSVRPSIRPSVTGRSDPLTVSAMSILQPPRNEPVNKFVQFGRQIFQEIFSLNCYKSPKCKHS